MMDHETCGQVPRIRGEDRTSKTVHRHTNTPFVIEDLDLGPATRLWTPNYLVEKVGASKPTIIHAADERSMSFRDKNFTYQTTPFGAFVERAVRGDHVYLRALSSLRQSKKPASLEVDYHELAKDFELPESLNFVKKHQHSSVLRITGQVNMWLHYDVMSNILCQIKGSKRVILFPPKDVSELAFPPGETTSPIDSFAEPQSSCHMVETVLAEGDVLFIPACWPHATAPLRRDPSVAINIFFRSFDDSLYAAGRDVYGNRDLALYENGRRDIGKIIAQLKKSSPADSAATVSTLASAMKDRQAVDRSTIGFKEVNRIVGSAKHVPPDIARFYLDRLADELVASNEQCAVTAR